MSAENKIDEQFRHTAHEHVFAAGVDIATSSACS